jgi:hypothetical protein
MPYDEKPGESEQAKLLEDARSVSIRAAVEKLRVIHRLKEESGGMGADCDPGCPPETVGDKLAAVGDLAFDLARFQISAHDELLKLSAKHTDRLLDGLRRDFRRRRRGPKLHPVAHVRAIANKPNRDFHFLVENRHAVPIYVSLTAAEFQRLPDGQPAAAAHVRFVADPPVTDPKGDRYLPAHQRRTFRFEFTPAVPPFEAGRAYRTAIFVATDGCVLEELPLHVHVEGK